MAGYWKGLLAAAAILAASASTAIAATCPNVGFAVVEGARTQHTRPVTSARGRTLFVRKAAITTTGDIAKAELDARGDDALLLLTLTPDGAERLERATTDHDGLRLALVADDEALMVVTWQGK